MSGMHETPPADLDQALIDLEADAPAPSAFERVARLLNEQAPSW